MAHGAIQQLKHTRALGRLGNGAHHCARRDPASVLTTAPFERLPGVGAHRGALSSPQEKFPGVGAAPIQRRRSTSPGGGGRGGGGGGGGRPRLLLVLKGARLEQPSDETPLERGELPHRGRTSHLMREAISMQSDAIISKSAAPQLPHAAPDEGGNQHAIRRNLSKSTATRWPHAAPSRVRD